MSNHTDLVSSLRMQIFLDILGDANHAHLIELIAMERDQEKMFIFPLTKFNPAAGTIDPSIICLDGCTYNEMFSGTVEGGDEKKLEITHDGSATSVPQANEPVPTGLKSSGHRYNHFLNTPLAKIGTESANGASIAVADHADTTDDIFDIDITRLYKILTGVPTPIQCKWGGCRETVDMFEFDDLAQHSVKKHSSCIDFLSDYSTGRLLEPVECQWDKGVDCRKKMKGLKFSHADEIARHLWDYHGIGERIHN